MPRILKIIFFLLLALLLVFGIYRYITLKQESNRSGNPLTYRAFFGLSESEKIINDIDNPYTPDFENPQTGGGNTPGTPRTGPNQPSTPNNREPLSAFGTTPPFSPAGEIGRSNAFNQNPDTSDDPTPGNNTPGNDNTPAETATAVRAVGDDKECVPEDIDIEFTAAELAQLAILEERFNQLAPTLVSDQAVKTERANYQTFKVKNDKIVEYKNYCFQQTAKFADKNFLKRLPTPFWTNPALNTPSFKNTPDEEPLMDDPKGRSFIERLFRLNVW